VGHDDHSHASLGEVLHDAEHFTGKLRIEGRSHLVEKHDLWPHGERAGNCHTLLLATGQLFGICVDLLEKADFGENCLRQPRRLIFQF
jgi:hypothetical protein